MAKSFYDMETKEGLVVTTYKLNGTSLDVEYTALKRIAYPPEAHYGWWYNIGVLFKPEELPVGFYVLETQIDVWIDGFGWWTYFYWVSTFNILECWH
ncbi:MAG: hypothetical protein FK731_04315 [Asgard group archaeon]|nr:hypothetical protein [Asgard group archaeon]